jgi:membrane associated rhomboid family serine protease
MGLYDRDYTQENFEHRYQNVPQMRMTLPTLTPIVKWLLIANILVFFAGIFFHPANFVAGFPQPITFLKKWFSIFPNSLTYDLQIWRLITYQFLHSGPLHILFNMLGLYFLGPTLERYWGSRRFLIFYLGCGMAGGLFYTLLVAVNFLPALPMVGASGAILGMLAACAILFPQFVVILIIFPVPIRLATVLLVFVYIANVMMVGQNAGGDAAHLAGMAAGALYVFSQPWFLGLKSKIHARQWEKKMIEQRDMQAEVDKILFKVHQSGLHSLTWKEKKILRKATQFHQQQIKP